MKTLIQAFAISGANAARRRAAVIAALLAWGPVATSFAQHANLTLKQGDVLTGELIASDDDNVVLHHPLLGELTLPRASIQEIKTDPGTVQPSPGSAASPNTGATAPPPETAEGSSNASATTRQKAVNELQKDVASDAEATANNLPAYLAWLSNWAHSLDLSFTGAQGISRYQSYVIGYAAQRDDEKERTNLQSRWYRLENDITEINETKAHVQLQQDWFLEESHFFPFVRGRWDYDNRQFWEQRYEGFAGVGYTVAESEDVEANLRVAGGVVHERFGEDRTRGQSLLSAAVVRWQIDDQQDISGETTLYPRMNADDSFRVNTRVEWRIQLAAVEGMSFKLGLENEYESALEDEDDTNDLLYFAGLSFDF